MAQLLAVKGNREVKIADAEKKSFLEQGFDIFEVEEGKKPKVVATASTADKKLSAALAEIASLKKKIEELEKGGSK